jgi:1-acyl-sn-glycerol-3-phosphate acyltransferase
LLQGANFMSFLTRIIWSLWAIPWILFITVLISISVLIAAMLGAGESFLQRLAHAWGRWLLLGIGCRVSISGLENIEEGKPYVFACNHSSALDIPVLFKALPKNFRWIAKKELFRIFLFGPAMKKAGYIPLDRSNRKAARESLDTASARIKAGASVVIFPEGTRSRDGRVGDFKTGGFLLALKAEQPVVPVMISNACNILPPRTVLLRPGKITVQIGRPIDISCYDLKHREGLALHVRLEVLRLEEREKSRLNHSAL